jgi:hypothetical protein
MKLVTFNIRCAWHQDGINSFLHRAGGIASKIAAETPDVICFQECTDKIFAHLKILLPEYHIVFNQRNADLRGEGLATALRKNTAELLGLDAFWLSPTPYVAGSRYEEQSQNSFHGIYHPLILFEKIKKPKQGASTVHKYIRTPSKAALHKKLVTVEGILSRRPTVKAPSTLRFRQRSLSHPPTDPWRSDGGY